MSAVVRHGWVPGVVGEVVQAHAAFYAREWSFGPFFEAKVAREMGDFLLRYDPAKDRLFRAEGDGAFLGSLTVDGGDPAIKGAQRARLEAATAYLDAAPVVVAVARDAPVPDVDLRLPTDVADVRLLSEVASTWGVASSVDRVLTALRIPAAG